MDLQPLIDKVLYYSIQTIIILGTLSILVFLHEFGHFIFARLAGVKVLEFAFGMGKLLYSIKIGETDYQLRLVPMGGYVKLKGEEILDVPDYKPQKDEFYGVSALKRLRIVLAGPFFNLLLAFFAFFIVFFIKGEMLTKPYIGYIEKESIALKQGIKSYDLITKINGQKIESFEKAVKIISQNGGKKVQLEVLRDDKKIDFEFIPEIKFTKDIIGDPLSYGDIGINPYIKPVVGNVLEDSPALKLGLKKGDVIKSLNGIRISFWNEMLEVIKNNPNKEIEISWDRDGKIYNSKITPITKEYKIGTEHKKKKSFGVIGVSIGEDKEMIFHKEIGFLESFYITWSKLYLTTTLTYKVLKKMFRGKVSKDNLMGPVRLAGIVSDVAKSGFFPWLLFLGFISHQLAIINLLPFPALDGGHAMFFIIEFIFRKPINFKVQEMLTKIGFSLLIVLFVFVIVNDITNMIGK